MQIFVNTNYDFLKWRFRAVAISVIFVLVGVALFAMNGVKLGIDFAGGATVTLKFQEHPPIDKLRTIVSDATIQQYGKAADNEVLLRLPKQEKEGDYAGAVVQKIDQTLNPDRGSNLDLNLQGRDAVAELLKSKDPDKKGQNAQAHDYYYLMAQSIIEKRSDLGIFKSMQEVASVPGLSNEARLVLEQNAFLGKFNVLNQETVGPQVGRELQVKALLAIILATLAMGVYIALRFDLKFGVAAIVCVAHDVAVTLAFLAMIGGEFEIITIASLLMVVGYSINDKVVVYDRVRENVKKLRSRDSFESILNHSLNQTLSRTVLTGGTVLLVLLSLILFGGQVINEFAWLLLIGIIAGTYSTLTVAPAVVVAWNNRSGKAQGRNGGPRRASVEREEQVEKKKAS